MRTAPALTLAAVTVAGALPGHDGPTAQAGAPPREGWWRRNVARWSWVSKEGTR